MPTNVDGRETLAQVVCGVVEFGTAEKLGVVVDREGSAVGGGGDGTWWGGHETTGGVDSGAAKLGA